MWFDFDRKVRKSLGAKFMLITVFGLLFISLSNASFFLYDKVKDLKEERIHNGFMLLEVCVLLSKTGLIEMSIETLEQDVFPFIEIIF